MQYTKINNISLTVTAGESVIEEIISLIRFMSWEREMNIL